MKFVSLGRQQHSPTRQVRQTVQCHARIFRSSQWLCLGAGIPTPSSWQKIHDDLRIDNIPNRSSPMANPQCVTLTRRASRNSSTH